MFKNKIPKEYGPCAKQKVVAILVTKDGDQFYGENLCKNPQEICPRDLNGCKSGEGYELCDSVCNQISHAEVYAINAAKEKAKGSVIHLFGHSYACENCKNKANDFNVEGIRVYK